MMKNTNIKPKSKAIDLKRRLLIGILIFPYGEEISSDVISRIIVIIASHSVISIKLKGKVIFHST
jgi:hypothetical protein